MSSIRKWVAIGDSFTYINDHLDETNYRIHKGYLTDIAELLPFPVEVKPVAINGGKTIDFVGKEFPFADFYTILLGINDWYWCGGIPLGTKEDFEGAKGNTTLGALGAIVKQIRAKAPLSPIFLASPLEHGLFIYQFDYHNFSYPTDRPNRLGAYVKEYAEAYRSLEDPSKGIYYVDTHGLSGFTPENAVRFFRREEKGKTVDVPYSVFGSEDFHPSLYQAYPYPKEAEGTTYDGLHPSDSGARKIAEIFVDRIREVVRK